MDGAGVHGAIYPAFVGEYNDLVPEAGARHP
jgi:hypothetical protein